MFFESTQAVAFGGSSAGSLTQSQRGVRDKVRLAEKLLPPPSSVTIWPSHLIHAAMALEVLCQVGHTVLGIHLKKNPQPRSWRHREGRSEKAQPGVSCVGPSPGVVEVLGAPVQEHDGRGASIQLSTPPSPSWLILNENRDTC